MTTVAVLGTGLMGSGIARSVLRSGAAVRVWNRTMEKARLLEQDGATVHEDPTTAVAGADVVITMMFDADAVESVMTGVLPALAGDAVWLQMGTIGVEAATHLAELAESNDTGFIDAPALGTREPAELGKLVVLAAGPEQLRPTVEPVLDAISSRTIWVSERPGDGHRLKLVGNSWVLSIVGATAQAIALARASGLQPELFLEAIGGGPSDCAYAQMKGKSMIGGDFAPSFTMSGAVKDSRMIAEALSACGLDASLMEALSEQYSRAARNGHETDDLSAVVEALDITAAGGR